MKRVYITRFGPTKVLQASDEVEPVPRPGEVRIRIAAAGVSFADILARQGRHPHAPVPPFVPGHEVAGHVDAVGPGASSFREGDSVLAFVRLGGYGEAVCVPHRQVWPSPRDMPATEAAALVLDYLSAYFPLVTMASIQAGSKVLIHEVATSVGLAALDICSVLGVETYGTAPEKHHFVLSERGLGHAVDLRKHDFFLVLQELTQGQRLDAILDPTGGRHWRRNYRLLAPTGRLILLSGGSASTMASSFGSSVRLLFQALLYSPARLARDCRGVLGFDVLAMWHEVRRIRKAMGDLLEWYQRGWIRPLVGQSLPLAEAATAHTSLQQGDLAGKLLLIP